MHRFVVRHSIEQKLYRRAEALSKSSAFEAAIASPSKRSARTRKQDATPAGDEREYSSLSVGELLQLFEQSPEELDEPIDASNTKLDSN